MTRYSDTRETLATEIRPTNTTAILGKYQRMVADLELDTEPVPGVNELAERAAALRSHERNAPAQAEAATVALVASLAAGTTDPDDAPAQVAANAATIAADPEVADVLRRAAQKATGSAVHLVSRAGESTFYDLLRPIVADAIDTANKVAPKLDGITTADQAADAGPTVASAWAQLVGAHHRWVNAHKLAEMLRDEGLLPPTVGEVNGRKARLLIPLEHQYARPDLMTTPRTAIHRRNPRELIDEAAAGPGIYTTAEAAEHVAAILAAEPRPERGINEARPQNYGQTSRSSAIATEVAAIVSGHLPAA